MSKLLLYLQVTISVNMQCGWSMWPPPFQIDLANEEVFVIGDEPTNDELIEKGDVAYSGLEEDGNRFNRLHQHVSKYARKQEMLHFRDSKFRYEETNFDGIEPQPWQVDYANSFSNDTIQALTPLLVARSPDDGTFNNRDLDGSARPAEQTTDNYNYEELKGEYEMEVRNEERLNSTFNYTDIREKESVKDALEAAVDFSTPPKNCTAEQLKGIGYNAFKCIWNGLQNADNTDRKRLYKSLFRIFGIWLAIYITIAIPCWLEKGWCCCCFRCKCCRPREEIDECKKFLVDNPPGLYRTSDNNVIQYKSNIYEKYAYKNLKSHVMKL